MNKTIATIAASTLALLIAIASVGLAQPGAAGAPDGDPIQTRILVAFNRAELSLEQLQSLQGMAETTLVARDEVTAAHDALQDFLVNWTGSADAFETAFEAERAKVQEAADALHGLQAQNADAVKDMLSANQYQALAFALRPLTGPGDRPERPANAPNFDEDAPGPRGRRAPDGNAPQNAPDGPQGRRGGPGRGGPGAQLAGLDTLLEVIDAKIAALQ